MRYHNTIARPLIALVLVLLPLLCEGAGRDDFPSCYGMLGDDAPSLGTPQRALFLLIDETVASDSTIQRAVIDKALRYLRPGDEILVARFAAFIDGHYSNLILRGRLDPVLSEKERFTISKRALYGFDQCMKKQENYVRQKITASIMESFNKKEDIPKTELLNSLATFSELVAQQASPQKTVLLFSDMLENSDITSFYKAGSLRTIDPATELAKLQDKYIHADWDGAAIYVIGAGLTDNPSAYHDGQALTALRSFWRSWFEKHQANLEGWGQPMLMQELQ